MNQELIDRATVAVRLFLPSLVRHVLTAAGATAVQFSDGDMEKLVGGVVALIGLYWSWRNSTKSPPAG